MNVKQTEKDISISEMQLLVTAVISFNSSEIVAAVLNVEKLKNALRNKFNKELSRKTSPVRDSLPENIPKVAKPESPIASIDNNDVKNYRQHESQEEDEIFVCLTAKCPVVREQHQDNCMSGDNDKSNNAKLDKLKCTEHGQGSTDQTTAENQDSSKNESNCSSLKIEGGLIHSTCWANDQTRLPYLNDKDVYSQTKKQTQAEQTSELVSTLETNQESPHLYLDKQERNNERTTSHIHTDKSDVSQEKKTNRIDQLLKKHVEAEESPSFQVFNQVSYALSNCSKPLNLSLPQRSRKRKNTSPKHVRIQLEESPEKHGELFLQQPHSHSNSQSNSFTADADSLAVGSSDPTLLGPFITPGIFTNAPANHGIALPLFDEDDTENNSQFSSPFDLSDVPTTSSSVVPNPSEFSYPLISDFKLKRTIGNPSGGSTSHSSLKTVRKREHPSGLSKNSIIKHDQQNSPLRLRCRRCNERFTTKTDYQQHLQSQVCSTSYTQTHTCQICGYCALTRQRLIVHLRTHSGERPHRCPFCSYAATQQAPLKRHIQNIHMKQGAISLST